MPALFDTGIFSITDSGTGAVGAGWKLNFYTTGTTSRLNTYPTLADANAGTNANANPVVADAYGRLPAVWLLDQDYKAVLTDASGVVKVTRDPINNPALSGSGGSASVGFIQSGTGATATTVQAALRRSVNVSDFGAVGNGTTDDTTALTNFFNHAMANPGVPHYLNNATYAITAALPTVNVSNTWIEGAGSEVHDTGTVLTGTVIKWTGAVSAGTSMVTLSAVSGGANTKLGNVTFKGIGIDAQAKAGFCLSIYSLWDSVVDVSAIEATNSSVFISCVATLGEAADTQKNVFKIKGRQFSATSGLCLDVYGTATANVAGNRFHFSGQHANVEAVRLRNSDNNDWDAFTTYCAGSATYAGVLYGSNGGANLGARGERFWWLSGNKPLYAQGTGDATNATKRHRIFFRDIENGTPAVVLGTGAYVEDQAWNSYNPTIAATGGTGFTYGSNTGEYRVWNGLCEYRFAFSCTAQGAGNTGMTATVPITAATGFGGQFVGRERASTGKAVFGYIDSGTSSIILNFYDGSYCGVTGGSYSIQGSYKVTP